MEEKNSKRENRGGIIFLNGSIDGAQSERVCREIIRINTEHEAPIIQMIINSQGGYCSDGFAIVDLIEWSPLPVYTTGVGMVASMGLLIFASGEKGHRVLTPRTSVLSHRYFSLIGGNYSSLVAARVEEDLMHQRIVNHYIQHSAIKTEEELNAKLLRDVDTWLTPEQAVEYGLADIIQTDRKRPYPNYKIKG